jgi:hypothetical protein
MILSIEPNQTLLLEGQRYAFSEYCIQQNNLIAVTVEKITDVTFKIIKGYSGEEVRGTFIHKYR